MSHLRKVSAERADWMDASAQAADACILGAAPMLADAKTDFLNAIFRAWNDYVYAKKNGPLV
jgi:hypothetical protein